MAALDLSKDDRGLTSTEREELMCQRRPRESESSSSIHVELADDREIRIGHRPVTLLQRTD